VKNISELKGIHKGYDIYVVASGASAGYIDESYFDNKYTIGVNRVWQRFHNLDYVVMKESTIGNAMISASRAMGFEVIVSRHNCGILKYKKNAVGDYVFDHLDNKLRDIDLSVIGTDTIVVSYSTITSAIHIAAYMGASNVILIGHDCGTLDGLMNYPGYEEAPGGKAFYRNYITEIEPQTVALRERIKEVYNCNVYSLNPFINFGLEGHKYER